MRFNVDFSWVLVLSFRCNFLKTLLIILLIWIVKWICINVVFTNLVAWHNIWLAGLTCKYLSENNFPRFLNLDLLHRDLFLRDLSLLSFLCYTIPNHQFFHFIALLLGGIHSALLTTASFMHRIQLVRFKTILVSRKYLQCIGLLRLSALEFWLHWRVVLESTAFEETEDLFVWICGCGCEEVGGLLNVCIANLLDNINSLIWSIS